MASDRNELLRAVDLRLTALKDEVVVAFDQAANARCSTKDISDLENFAHHIGAKDIRYLFTKKPYMCLEFLAPNVEMTISTHFLMSGLRVYFQCIKSFNHFF